MLSRARITVRLGYASRRAGASRPACRAHFENRDATREVAMGGKSRPYDAKALAILDGRKNWVLGFLRQSGGSREGTAETDFEELVTAGCPEYALLGHLWLLRIIATKALTTKATKAVTTKDVTGLNPRGVRQVIGHLRKAAAGLEILRGSTAIEAIEAILPWMGSAAALFDSLSELARCLENLLRGAHPSDSAIAR